MDTGAWQATIHGVTRVGHKLVPELCRTTCSQTPGSGIGLSAAFYLQDSQDTPSSVRERLPHFHELPPPATAPHPYCLIHRPMGRCPGGGHSHPLQYSCLENPMGRGAWWAAVHEIAQSRTRLKRLSSSSIEKPLSAGGCDRRTKRGREELPHVRGQGQRPTVPGCDGRATQVRGQGPLLRGATRRPRSGAGAGRTLP